MGEVTKQTGKAYKTDWRVNICECGETTTQFCFKEFEEGKELKQENIKSRICIAICKCGNIFHTPLMINNYAKIKDSIQT